MKRNTLRWFGHTERMKSERFVKVYVNETVGSNSKGRPLGRWKDREKEDMCERNAIKREDGLNKQGRNVWIGSDGGSAAVATLLGEVSKGSEAS